MAARDSRQVFRKPPQESCFFFSETPRTRVWETLNADDVKHKDLFRQPLASEEEHTMLIRARGARSSMLSIDNNIASMTPQQRLLPVQ